MKYYKPYFNVDQFWFQKKDLVPVISSHNETETPYNVTIFYGNHFLYNIKTQDNQWSMKFIMEASLKQNDKFYEQNGLENGSE